MRFKDILGSIAHAKMAKQGGHLTEEAEIIVTTLKFIKGGSKRGEFEFKPDLEHIHHARILPGSTLCSWRCGSSASNQESKRMP